MKPHFKPIAWSDMPMSARKTYFRLVRAFPEVDGLVRGVEWIKTFAEPNKTYLRTREMRWFVAVHN